VRRVAALLQERRRCGKQMLQIALKPRIGGPLASECDEATGGEHQHDEEEPFRQASRLYRV
jgi:hypothetical protein